MPIESLTEGLETINDEDARKESETWMTASTHIHGDLRHEIFMSCKVYLYLKRLIGQNGYSGVSISCISKNFPMNPIMPHPCLAFSRLRDQGISAVCEADVCALITSLLMEETAHKPSYMGNIAYVDCELSTITLTHCLTALKMDGYDRSPLPYSLQDYHHTGKGVVPSVDFPVDQKVTIGLISKDLSSFVVWPGMIIESGKDFCANMVKIKIPDAKGFRQNILGCHYVMVYGDIMKELVNILSDLNISRTIPFKNYMFSVKSGNR